MKVSNYFLWIFKLNDKQLSKIYFSLVTDNWQDTLYNQKLCFFLHIFFQLIYSFNWFEIVKNALSLLSLFILFSRFCLLINTTKKMSSIFKYIWNRYFFCWNISCLLRGKYNDKYQFLIYNFCMGFYLFSIEFMYQELRLIIFCFQFLSNQNCPFIFKLFLLIKKLPVEFLNSYQIIIIRIKLKRRLSKITLQTIILKSESSFVTIKEAPFFIHYNFLAPN